MAVDEVAGGPLQLQCHSLGVPGPPCPPARGSLQRAQDCQGMEGLHPPPWGLRSHLQKGWMQPGDPPWESGVVQTPSDVSMQGPEYLTSFASFLGSSFADRPCPASSRCWAAQGAVRGRHLPPACPVGAAPRRPWSEGPGLAAAAGDGGALGLHHRPEGESGAAQAPKLQQPQSGTTGKRPAAARTARSLQTRRQPAAAATGTGTQRGHHH